MDRKEESSAKNSPWDKVDGIERTDDEGPSNRKTYSGNDEAPDKTDSLKWGFLKGATISLLIIFLLLLASCGIVTMLPDDAFQTEVLQKFTEATVTLCLIVGAVLMIIKRKLKELQPGLFQPSDNNQEWMNVVQYSQVMSGIASITSALTFVLCFMVDKPHLGTQFYWGAMTFISIIAFFFTRTTSTDFDENDVNNWTKFWCYALDRYLLFLFLATYMYINLVEANETRKLYQERPHEPWHNITAFRNSSGNRTDHHVSIVDNIYEYSQTGAHTILAELMALMTVCKKLHGHTEHKHGEGCTLKTFRTPSWKTWSVAGLGFITIIGMIIAALLTLKYHLDERPLFIFYVKMGCYIVSSLYLILVLLLTSAHYAEGKTSFYITGVSKEEIKSCLDIVLLRCSMVVMTLFLCLVIVANATGYVVDDEKGSVSYLNLISNIAAIWLQYWVLFRFTCIHKDLEHHLSNKPHADANNFSNSYANNPFNSVADLAQNSGTRPPSDPPETDTPPPDPCDWQNIHKIMRWFLAPLILFNALMWFYNLYQWKAIAMLIMDDDRKPGDVWAVLEAALFPILVFFRFHSACMCLTLFQSPKREEQVASQHETQANVEDNGNDRTSLLLTQRIPQYGTER